MAARRCVYSLLTLALAAGPGFAAETAAPVAHHPIMHWSKDFKTAHRARRAAMPFAPEASADELYREINATAGANAGATADATTGDTMGIYLIPNINFANCSQGAYSSLDVPASTGVAAWNQNQCGDCWVWGSTAACSADYGVASGAAQLFSPQWFDSEYYAKESSYQCCNGGDSSLFASFYNSYPKFIPWTNTGATFVDGNGPTGAPAIAATAISTTPNVTVTGVTVSQISTQTVSQAQAIANIKAVLNNNQAVVLSYFLPGAGWTDFETAWSDNTETTPWADVDKYAGTTMDSSGGGHLVCVVGYDNTNSSWVVLNSWGTTTGRPDGYFELPQAMGYGDQMNDDGEMYQYEFDTYTVTGWPSTTVVAPTITTQPASQTITTGSTATFTVAASGTSPFTYQWYNGTTAISGATSASYTTPAEATAGTSTFYVTVKNSAGTATSSTATLTVSAAAPTAPTITTQPVSQTVVAPATATFTVVATGTGDTYQWYNGTTAISGATAASYTTPATTAGTSTYYVVVKNTAGSVTSSTATLTVTAAPAATQLILNPDFASGATSWTASSGVIGKNGPSEPAYSGTYDAWLDGYGSAHTDTLSQSVAIASTYHTATLTFELHIDTAKAASGGAKDNLTVVASASGVTSSTLATFSNLNAATGYVAHSYALPAAFIGKTVKITFTGTEASGAQTSFVVGQVNLNVQ
jgi:hypothetical protein